MRDKQVITLARSVSCFGFEAVLGASSYECESANPLSQCRLSVFVSCIRRPLLDKIPERLFVFRGQAMKISDGISERIFVVGGPRKGKVDRLSRKQMDFGPCR
jgi:hypothetical protein